MEDKLMRTMFIPMKPETKLLKTGKAQLLYGLDQCMILEDLVNCENVYLDFAKNINVVEQSAKQYATTRKYSILIDALDKTLGRCTIQKLDRTGCEIDMLCRADGREGRYFYDETYTNIIISDGTFIESYRVKSNESKDTMCFAANKVTRTSKFSEQGGRDGRSYIHLSVDDRNIWTVDRTVQLLKYTVNFFMFNDEGRDKMSHILLAKDGRPFDYVINHTNNDCRDNSIANLELCTDIENKIHSSFVEMIWSNPEMTCLRGEAISILASSSHARETYTKHTLNFHLRITDVLDLNSLIKDKLNCYREKSSNTRYTTAHIELMSQAAAEKIFSNYNLSKEAAIEEARKAVQFVVNNPRHFVPVELEPSDVIDYIQANLPDFAFDYFAQSTNCEIKR